MTNAPAPPPESEMPAAVRAWHEIAEARDPGMIDALLADEIVFRSPAVHTPQVGRARANGYLGAAVTVLGPTLAYRRQWYGTSSAVLEFEAVVGGLDVHGIDMIAWDEKDLITEFTVMVRPMKGLTALIEAMAAELARTSG